MWFVYITCHICHILASKGHNWEMKYFQLPYPWCPWYNNNKIHFFPTKAWTPIYDKECYFLRGRLHPSGTGILKNILNTANSNRISHGLSVSCVCLSAPIFKISLITGPIRFSLTDKPLIDKIHFRRVAQPFRRKSPFNKMIPPNQLKKCHAFI